MISALCDPAIDYDFNCNSRNNSIPCKIGATVNRREFPVTLLRIFTGGGGCIVSCSYTLSNFTRFEHKRKHCYRCNTGEGSSYMCVVVTIEYSADNLRYKLRFVNGQMVHFTNFCLYESFGPESLFRISSFKSDYGNRMDFPCEKQISI